MINAKDSKNTFYILNQKDNTPIVLIHGVGLNHKIWEPQINSFNNTVLRLEGEKVFILLSKFLVANLEKILETNFSVAQTIFIKIPILFIRNNTDKEETSLDLHLNRSHAKYVYDLLVDGSKNLNI